MRVLLTGASGAIGRRLVAALQCAGHEPVLAVRDVDAGRAQHPGVTCIAVDFAQDHAADIWLPRLAGIDAVVNAVGIFRESTHQRFESVHMRAPVALFHACVEAGVQRVVQLSALGADAGAASPYHRSKKHADDHLLALPLQATVLRPSLVFIPDGASTQLFAALALAPLTPLPRGGVQCVQPVHVDDVCAAVVAALAAAAPPRVLDVAGPVPLRLRDYMQLLRTAAGFGALRVAPVPAALARLAARHPHASFDADALAMLDRGSCADSQPLSALLARPPRSPDTFAAGQADALRRDAALVLLLPVLRIAIALVWLVTAALSFGLYPVDDSLLLLHRTGLPPALAPLALYGASALDLAIGVGMLVLPARWRRPLYAAQALLVAGYTLVIAVRLPEFLLHPFGPVLKNLPLLAGLWLLHRLERR